MKYKRLIFLLFVLCSASYASLDADCIKILEKHGHWTSDENRQFYNWLFETDPTYLQRRARACGLRGCKDLYEVRAEIKNALKSNGHALEIGGGAGRVIHWLLEEEPKAIITAVEHSGVSAKILRQKFKQYNQVHIEHDSILGLELREPADLALWMWAGFFELNPREKITALHALHQDLLKDDGLLLMDFPNNPSKAKSDRDTSSFPGNDVEAYFEFEVEGHLLHVHYISPEIVSMWARATGFYVENFYVYMTRPGEWRATAVLRKDPGSVDPKDSSGQVQNKATKRSQAATLLHSKNPQLDLPRGEAGL